MRVIHASLKKLFLADCSTYCGRPEIPFNDCSDRSKRRKTQDLLAKNSTETLSYATSMALRKSGNEDAAKLVKEITQTTPKRAQKIREIWRSNNTETKPSMMSTEEALSLIITTSLSKYQYNQLRSNALKHNHNLYPAYNQVLAAKKNSYPDDISITEEKCEVITIIIIYLEKQYIIIKNLIINEIGTFYILYNCSILF